METIEYKGYTISIEQDECNESPREWGNLGRMQLFHKQYDLANELDIHEDDFDSWEELERKLREDYEIVLPVFMYDHSGVGLSTSNGQYPYNCPWDSGQVGYIVADKQEILEWYKVKKLTKAVRERAIECLNGEVKLYSQYLNGEVYAYTVEKIIKTWDAQGNEYEHEKEFCDACCGYYSYEECLEQAKEYIDTIESK